MLRLLTVSVLSQTDWVLDQSAFWSRQEFTQAGKAAKGVPAPQLPPLGLPYCGCATAREVRRAVAAKTCFIVAVNLEVYGEGDK